MDILKYFNLNDIPFKVTPDPRFLYLSEQVKEAMAKCEYMARERVGPIYMYGPIGSGKTTILRRIYEKLTEDEQYFVLPVITPNLKTANAFLRFIMEEWEVKTERSYVQSLKNFERFLIEQSQKNIIPLLLIDEAQNLNRDTLRLIHYLLNFENVDFKLLQIVLVGQEELATKIIKYRELASRMFPIAISPMSLEDLKDMLKFRLMVAGSNDQIFEDDEAYKVLFAYTKGLPRDAVKVCDELLRVLVAKNRHQADANEVEEVSKQLNLKI